MKNDRLFQYTEKLIEVWYNWMNNHVKSNNEILPMHDRFAAAKECEELQIERRRILLCIDECIDEWVNV